MKIEVAVGEIVDKLSILLIKKLNIMDNSKLKNINKEYEYLNNIVFNKLNIEQQDFYDLFDVNEQLWKIEDSIRLQEKNKTFSNEFIELARLVYVTNDKRAELKKNINVKYGSKFIEEKSYEKY
jgi:hypothetical protein